MIPKPGLCLRIRQAFCIAALAAGFCLQTSGQEIEASTPIFNSEAPSGAVKDDPSLTTHETAVECALALILESAGERHAQLANVPASSFKAGLCAGKIQTYMLQMQAGNPSCFPKITLEEGMRMFVKWTEAHPEEGAASYPDGFKKAFEDAVPCLKK